MPVFGMRFAFSKCKMLLQNWIGPKPNFVLGEEELSEAVGFGYLVSRISRDGHISD